MTLMITMLIPQEILSTKESGRSSEEEKARSYRGGGNYHPPHRQRHHNPHHPYNPHHLGACEEEASVWEEPDKQEETGSGSKCHWAGDHHNHYHRHHHGYDDKDDKSYDDENGDDESCDRRRHRGQWRRGESNLRGLSDRELDRITLSVPINCLCFVVLICYCFNMFCYLEGSSKQRGWGPGCAHLKQWSGDSGTF